MIVVCELDIARSSRSVGLPVELETAISLAMRLFDLLDGEAAGAAPCQRQRPDKWAWSGSFRLCLESRRVFSRRVTGNLLFP
jgi:hypothetical protein